MERNPGPISSEESYDLRKQTQTNTSKTLVYGRNYLLGLRKNASKPSSTVFETLKKLRLFRFRGCRGGSRKDVQQVEERTVQDISVVIGRIVERSGFQVKHRHLENLHISTRISNERLSIVDKRGINLHNLCPLKRIHDNKQDKSPYSPASEVELLHLNIRSLKDRTHLLELRELASERKSSIITISETWLNTSVTSAEIEINGYKLHRLDRLHKRGGGVLLIYPQGSQIIRYKRPFIHF